MKNNILFPIVLSAVLSACASTNRSQYTAPLNASVESKLKAEVKVDMNRKLKGQANATILFGFLQISGPTKFADGVFASTGGGLFGLGGGGAAENLKGAAAYDALKGSQPTQLIVAPQYIIKKNDFFIFQTISVSVTGYSGTLAKIEGSSDASAAPAR